jgi:FkbM family methyltransferase
MKHAPAILRFPPLHGLLPIDSRVKVVDVGANPVGGDPPYADLLRRGHVDLVGFEPNRDALAVLNARKGPHERYLPLALGDGARHTLHFCASSGMTSLLRPNPLVLEMFHGFAQWGQVVGTEDIDTVRLDDVAETDGADLLKLDVQGAELMILQNARQRLSRALVVQVEAEFLQMYEGQPLFSELELFLREQGFVFHRFFPLVSRVIKPMVVNNTAFSGLSQIVWCDAIFVKDFIRPDGLSAEDILKLAVILHDCYGSVDLVLNLLLRHDALTGRGLGQIYGNTPLSPQR